MIKLTLLIEDNDREVSRDEMLNLIHKLSREVEWTSDPDDEIYSNLRVGSSYYSVVQEGS